MYMQTQICIKRVLVLQCLWLHDHIMLPYMNFVSIQEKFHAKVHDQNAIKVHVIRSKVYRYREFCVMLLRIFQIPANRDNYLVVFDSYNNVHEPKNNLSFCQLI